MANRIMADRINDIAWQAHQGSVAAIIQLLNEKLIQSGVRTRAMFAEGVLQILCEASKVEQLEQSTLVPRIQQILDATAPRNIRRVRINSRIVREQQLLWLREIEREDQLLWSEEIILAQPNLVKQLIQDFTEVQIEVKQSISPPNKSLLAHKDKQHKSPQTGLKIASSLFLILVFAWLFSISLGEQIKHQLLRKISPNSTPATNKQINSAPATTQTSNSPATPTEDPFGEAVRIANQASDNGKKATTSTQWLELAAQWQRASDLMGKVPATHSRYQEAKIRTQLYQKYSEAAQKEAQKSEK